MASSNSPSAVEKTRRPIGSPLFGGRLAGARAGLINRGNLGGFGVRFSRPPLKDILQPLSMSMPKRWPLTTFLLSASSSLPKRPQCRKCANVDAESGRAKYVDDELKDVRLIHLLAPLRNESCRV